MSDRRTWSALAKHYTGIDRAVLYTVAARLFQIVGSVVTVLLIVRFLSPIEQGYYYTLLSLVSLQLVFEMGFSFVVQQLAAHECIYLELGADGAVTGDRVAHARLASTLQLSLRWYSAAAVFMGLFLIPLGMVFFAHRGTAGAVEVAWRGPWILAVIASAIGLWCMPFYSFLEGCGQVRAVASMRLAQALATSACAWAPMLLHRGLYSPGMAIVGYVGIGLVFLAKRRRLLAGLLSHPAGEHALVWSREIWPFQWRIAVSWMFSYFTVQILIPILFFLRGPIEAGRMGMSLSITLYMAVLALAWTSTRTTQFGRLIAKREFQELDRLYSRTLGQSLAVFVLFAATAWVAVLALPLVAPHLADRIVSPWLFALLMLASGANFVVQSLAILLRSFKSEPFLTQSAVVASVTLSLTLISAARWGVTGAAFSYFVATFLVGFPLAWAIYSGARRNYLAVDALAKCQDQIHSERRQAVQTQ